MAKDQKNFIYLNQQEEPFRGVSIKMKQLWAKLEMLMDKQREHKEELNKINKEIESVKKEMTDYYDVYKDKIVRPNIQEEFKNMPPKTAKEIKHAEDEMIEAVEAMNIRDDKIAFLIKFLDKDWDRVYRDIIDWISDDEFDDMCRYMIRNPEDFKE